MSLVPPVPTEKIIDVPVRSDMNFTWSGMVKPSWTRFFNQARLLLISTQESGTTAQRPTANLWVGRAYFDESLGALGKEIWIAKDGATWVDGTGTAV